MTDEPRALTILHRFILCIVLPFALVWSFLSVLVHEIGGAFRYAWLVGVRTEIAAAKVIWNEGWLK